MPKRLLYIKEYEGFEEGNYSRWTKSGSGTATVGTDYKKFGTYGLQTTVNQNDITLQYKPKVFYIEDGETLVLGWLRLNEGSYPASGYCYCAIRYYLPYSSQWLAGFGIWLQTGYNPRAYLFLKDTSYVGTQNSAATDTWFYGTVSRSGNTITVRLHDSTGSVKYEVSDTFTDFHAGTAEIWSVTNFAANWNAWYDNVLIEKRRILT